MATNAAIAVGVMPGSNGGTVDLTVSGFGTVQAAVVFCSNANSTSNPQDFFFTSVGFWDGVNSVQHSYSQYSGHGGGTADSARYSSKALVINLSSVTGTCSAITDGIRITQGGTSTLPRYITAILINGVTDVHLAEQNLGTGTSPIDITAPGFKPSLVFFGSSGLGAAPASGTFSSMSFGVAHNNSSDTVTQGYICCNSDNGAATMDTMSIVSHSYIAAQLTNNAAVWQASVGSFDPSGFSITPSASASSDYLSYLAIELADPDDCWVDILDAATSTGDLSQSGIGFEPQVVGLACNMATSLDTVTSGATINLGAGDGTTQQCISGSDENGAGTSDTSNEADTSNILQILNDDGTQDGLASLSTLDSDGFTLNYSDAASSAKKILAFAIGDSTAGGGGPNVNINGSTVSWNGLTSYNWNGIA